ncbi:hypothetical protein FRAHR75_640011 [Frankia sp. Hr75.2]|nr:hypothetical protein FRAHR75_640011 [Frankia sp. Hr75.2]
MDTVFLQRIYVFFVVEHATAESTSSGSPSIRPRPG